jgi:eukaryotic-like serine/threonine-protein kinase
MTGRKLGNYDIVDKLGEGGMGQVWRAKDARLNRTVAVKILPADVAGDTVRRERFEQEARALGALNHPNIVAVYDVGQSDGQAYIVSELVEGEPLRAVIERGPVPQRKMLDIAVQTAEGIAAAHALGIVHRDLKPENIMISRDGRVKVLDFGLAKQNAPITEETATIALSSPGMVLGTVGYMSPEQVRGEVVDARSDIFSFGCVLYEMASGKQPFTGKSAADAMSAVLREDPPELNPAPSAGVAAILHRCLEKDPARRFQSAADLAFALRSIGQLTGSQTAMERPAAAHPRHKWLFVALAAAAAFLLVALGLFLRGRSAGPALPNYQRLTFREGGVGNARFAPDRQNIVYSANWDMQESQIFISTPGNPEARALGIQGTRLLSLSSKGDLALLMGPFSPDDLGTLARGTLAGGQPRPLLENVRFADWSPDGSEMAIVRRVGEKLRLEYPIGKVLFESQWILGDVRVSPDGQRVAFATFGSGGLLSRSRSSTGPARWSASAPSPARSRSCPPIA